MRIPDPYETLRERAAAEPERVAFRFLGDPDDPAAAAFLTYGQLLRRADAVAARLAARAQPGERALLLFPSGLSFVAALFGCIAAGVVGVPLSPPQPGRERRAWPRLKAVALDAAPRLLLTDRATLAPIAELAAVDPLFAALETLEVGADSVGDGDGDGHSDGDGDGGADLPEAFERPAGRGELIYLQYTSGSTALPKGVMVERAALWHNLEAMRQAWNYHPGSRALIWVPNFHDDGLVHGILQPVHSGYPCCLMSPLDLLSKPVRWLRAISHFAATHSGGPNFAYELALRKIGGEDLRGLDLSSWKMAYNAAEPVRSDTLDRFTQAFAPHGFRRQAFHPSFGLAEAILLVSTGAANEAPPVVLAGASALEREQRFVPAGAAGDSGRPLVGCGRAVPGTRLETVDPETRLPLPEDRIGEIWVAAPSLAGGYWQKPEASAATFGAYLAGSGEGPFLRTGDLGFQHGGELFVTGRLKDLIILHGRNIYPHDLEQSAERSDPAVRAGCSAAFSVDAEGEERLVLVAEIGSGAASPEATVERLRLALATEHELPVGAIALIRAGSLPKTSSGKVQRRECRRMYLGGELEVVHLWRSSGQPVAAAPAGERDPAAVAGELVAFLRDFAQHRFDPALADARRSLPPHAILELGNRGIFGLQVPRRWGGLELPASQALRVYRQLGSIDLTLASLVCAHNTLGLQPLVKHGSEAQQAALLPGLAAGRGFASFALTEPGAGSNPRALATRAEPAGEEGFRLYGEKSWIGSATWAGVLIVFARHKGAPGSGVSAFLLRPGGAGLQLGPEIPTLGLRAMVQAKIRLDGVAVGAGDLLGKSGDGITIAQEALSSARLALAAICLGGIERCALLMSRFAARRNISTGSLGDHPVFCRRLAGTLAAAGALSALLEVLAAGVDEGKEAPGEIYLAAKVAASELVWQAADDLVQTLGSRGYADHETPARFLRDARVFRIVEGPTEVLTAFLGARAWHDPELFRRFFEDALGAPEIAAALRAAAAALGRQGADPRWGHDRLGWLAVDGLLAAAAARAGHGKNDDDEDRALAADWARRRFEVRLAEILAGGESSHPLPPPGALRAAALRLAEHIGELDPATIGEQSAPDPLLALHPPASAREPLAPLSLPAPPPPRDAAASEKRPLGAEETIATWLCTFIAERRGLAPDTIERDRPFEFHGIDSVTSASMMASLGQQLGRTLSPTLLWAHPSVAALARHLATEAVQATSS